MTTRTAEAFLPYLTFSIYGTLGSLRMTNGHPYGEVGCGGEVAECRTRVSKPLPYGFHLLRIWVRCDGEVREEQAPPLQ